MTPALQDRSRSATTLGTSSRSSRRRFLRDCLAATGGAVVAASWPRQLCADAGAGSGLIASIERQVVFPGRQTGMTWFHPRACVAPTGDGIEAVMTTQSISGSDYFGTVHATVSRDLGHTWTEPRAIPGFGRSELDDGYQVGTCDAVPEYHAATGTVLAVGHNVYYKEGKLAQPQLERWPMYAVRDANGDWSTGRRLEWDDPRGAAIYTCGCAQRVTRDDGDIVVALSFAPKGRPNRSVLCVRCSYDGRDLRIVDAGNELVGQVKRGLLEPSIVASDGRYFMTIRTEDNHGYVATSDDGLRWAPQQPWCWENGEPLVMSTTQQHWLSHSDALFLVYTRKTENNVAVMRWRAPLYMAEVDRDSLRLRRDTEQIVFPLIGDGLDDPKHVARMGNFHCNAVTPDESWVTVGETLPDDGWAGDTLLARVRWSKPNRQGIATFSSRSHMLR